MSIRLHHVPNALGRFALIVGALLGANGLRAAEADINRELLPSAPKRDLAAPRLSVPNAPSDQWRKDLMKEVTSPQSLGPIPPPITPNRMLTREQEEQVDKKRNWIFVSPQDSVTRPEEALRVRDDRPTDQPYRNVMLQFLDKDGSTGARGNSKTNDSNSADGTSNDNKEKSSRERNDPLNRDPLNRGALKDDLELGNWGRREDPLSIRKLMGSSGRDTNGSRDGSSSNAVPGSGADGAASNGPGYSISNATLADRMNATRDRRDLADDKQARNQEFQDLLNRRTYPTRPDSSTGGAADPINMLTDPSVSALNAVSPRGMNTLPTAPRLSVTTPQPVGRTGASPGLPESPGRGFTPAGTTTTPVLQPQKPVHQPRPVVLEIPRRKL